LSIPPPFFSTSCSFTECTAFRFGWSNNPDTPATDEATATGTCATDFGA